MLGLVQYDSDEEDDKEVQQHTAPSIAPKDKGAATTSKDTPSIAEVKQDVSTSDATANIIDNAEPAAQATAAQGPERPPTAPQDDASTFGPMRPPSVEISYPLADEASDNGDPSLSPYSHNRSLLRGYTIPTLEPGFSIPDSPPGSPTGGIAKQFAQFRALKKKEVHFNQKLSQTTALRNPNLLENLMKHVGIDSAGQYVSNWNKDIWNPDPEYLASGIEKRRGETPVQALARLQKEGFDRRQSERTAVEFVGSTVQQQTQQQLDAGGNRGGQAPVSAAERVMSGLDRERKSSPALPRRDGQGQNRRQDERERDHNRHRDDGRRDRHREEPDRHKRPRSRSREHSRDRQRYRERDYNRR